MVKAKTKNETYEELYTTLTKLVDTLENGNLSLDESLKLYQEAMNIAQQCQLKLEDAQTKLDSITKTEA